MDPKKIQLKVTVILKYWVENQFFDFDDELVKKLHDFIECELPKDGYGDPAQRLKLILKQQVISLPFRAITDLFAVDGSETRTDCKRASH